MLASRAYSKLLFTFLVILICLSLGRVCPAQTTAPLPAFWMAPYFFPVPFYGSYYFPQVAPIPSFMPNFSLSTPFLTPPSLAAPRTASTVTVITLPTANPVTASAPLGTLNLTPSTLVFLILLFTLH